MIHIYLVRHGIAVDPAEKGTLDDDSRPLTGKGRRRFRRLARTFAQLGEIPDFIFTSPLVRAVQTAEILAGPLKMAEVGILDELRPDGGVGKVLAETGRRVKEEQSVALVGHDPQMTQLVIALADLSKEDAERVDFKKGSIVRIDVGELPSARPSQAKWWLKPRSRTLAKGVPLKKKLIEAKPSKARPSGSH